MARPAVATASAGALVLSLLMSPAPAQRGSQRPELSNPVLLEAAGEPIDVTTGHAAPYFFDFDGDGLRDLLVGEFGTGKFDNAELPDELAEGWKKAGRFANGKVRIYRNVGSAKRPKFASFSYLQANGEDAAVPIT